MATCGSCRYYDPDETWGSKGHCDWIRIYVYPDDKICSHYQKRGSGGGCYLTTACCGYHELPDDCRELTAMRKLRDSYLRKSDEGNRIVDEYYRTAPAIVEKIEASPNREELYDYIFTTVENCANLVDDNDYESATNVYLEMVGSLERLVA